MSDKPKNGSPDRVLAAEYVLGVLPHAERRAFAAKLETDAALREEVRLWSEQLAPLADGIEAVEPPLSVLAAIEERIFPQQSAPAGWWSNLQFWRGLAIASLAALVLAGAWLAVAPGPTPQRPSYVAEIAAEDGAIRLVALFDANEGLLRLNRTEGSPHAGRDFELWLIEGGNVPVSLGVLSADARSSHRIPDELRARLSGAVLAVSDEPDGGSPTGQPTGAVLATGQIVEI